MKKTVVITGSTRGIGNGLATQFLKRGHQIVLNGRNEALLKKRIEEFAKDGYEVIGVVGDVSKEATFKELVEAALAKFGKIDIWINNAGIPQAQKYFYDLDGEAIESLVSINILGLMLGTKVAVNYFREQGYGKVFNMEGFGSDGRMMDKLTLYGTSKRAVNYFTKSVSKEVKEEKIQVGILSPGMVRTEFLDNSSSTGDEAEQAKNKRVFDILAEDVDVVTEFLVDKILLSKKKYDRIEFLTKRRLFPKIIKLMFVNHA